MDMITHGIYLYHGGVVILHHSSDVSVELAAFLIAEQWASLLGAEHEMNHDIR
jgi:hypothetical protein